MMHNEAIFDYLIHNGHIVRTDAPEADAMLHRKSVYEVIRLIRGVPLFFREHIDRLYASAELAGITLCLTPVQIQSEVRRLAALNSERNCNIKLLFSEDGSSYAFYFLRSSYPTETMREKGVHTVLYRMERSNPNAKINKYEVRAGINAYRAEHGAYEALLVDSEGLVTEGSRSNLFFTDGEGFRTAGSSRVLLGITRSKVLELCRSLGIPVKTAPTAAVDLQLCKGAFLTSTSSDVLPVASIEDTALASGSHPLIIRLQKAYLQMMEEDLAEHAAGWTE